MRNCEAPSIPTLKQLRDFRRTGKVDVMKSAGPIIPVHNPRTGGLLGYGRAERIDVSKAAPVADANACLDGFFPFVQSCGVEVEKTANLEHDPTAELMGIFPLFLQHNPNHA